MMKNSVIMGIDPGFSITGYGVLRKEHSKAYLVDYGYLKLPSKYHLSQRIGIFYTTLKNKIEQFSVSDIAL